MPGKGKATESHADRLMADLRSKISTIASDAERSGEDCVSFYRKETDYADWIKRHRTNGYILHRDSAAAKTAKLHVTACPVIGGSEDGAQYTTSPKVGCPTREAAMAYARMKKWKVNSSCEQCPE